MQKTDLAIIGAGITGLTIAAYAKKLDLSFQIYDSDPGGLIRTEKKNGFILELGPNVFLQKPAFRQLVKDFSFEDQVVEPALEKYEQYIWCDNQIQLVPKGLAKFFASKIFSWPEKFKIISSMFKKQRFLTSTEDQSVLEFFKPIIGKNLCWRLLDPALQGIYGGNIETLSARSLFSGLWKSRLQSQSLFAYMKTKQRNKICMFKDGNQTLTDRLLAYIGHESLVQARVTAVESFSSSYKIELDNSMKVTANKVLVTTSGSASLKFCSFLPEAVKEKMKSLEFVPLSVVHAHCAEDCLSLKKAFGVLFPSQVSQGFLGVMFNSNLYPHMTAPGRSLLTICLGGHQRKDLVGYTDEKLWKFCVDKLQEYIDIKAVELLSIKHWPRAIPQYTVGHYQLQESLRQQESLFPGLYFAGAEFEGVGVPDRIEAAYQLLQRAELIK